MVTYLTDLQTASNRREIESECRTNLKAALAAERAHFQVTGRFSTHITELGFEPERNNRYAYIFDERGSVEDRSEPLSRASLLDTAVGPDIFKHGTRSAVARSQLPNVLAGGVGLGISDGCLLSVYPYEPPPGCFVTVVCAGQLDDDPALDLWSISTGSRRLAEPTLGFRRRACPGTAAGRG